MVLGQRSKIGKYSQAHNFWMATARTFKLSEDINFNLGNKTINIMNSYPKAPDLESKLKNVKISGNLIKFKQIFLSVIGQ